MITKKRFNRLIDLFDKTRGPQALLIEEQFYSINYELIFRKNLEDSNISFSQLYNDVLKGKSYNTKNLLMM